MPRLLVMLVVLLPGAAVAAIWHGDQNSGALRFVAIQAGAKFSGHFGEFRVRLDFDPAKPADGRLEVRIVTKSADTSDAERDGVLHGKDFFWVERFPEAKYEAQSFRRENGAWTAAGELTLRGVTQPVTVRFEIRPQLRQLGMKGSVTLRRLEFGIGQGEWTDTTWLGDPVDVAFDLRLQQENAAADP